MIGDFVDIALIMLPVVTVTAAFLVSICWSKFQNDVVVKARQLDPSFRTRAEKERERHRKLEEAAIEAAARKLIERESRRRK